MIWNIIGIIVALLFAAGFAALCGAFSDSIAAAVIIFVIFATLILGFGISDIKQTAGTTVTEETVIGTVTETSRSADERLVIVRTPEGIIEFKCSDPDVFDGIKVGDTIEMTKIVTKKPAAGWLEEKTIIHYKCVDETLKYYAGGK